MSLAEAHAFPHSSATLNKSPVVKRSIVIGGHKTSVSLEEPFWTALKRISAARKVTLSDLVSEIDVGRHHGNLSSAIRLFVLDAKTNGRLTTEWLRNLQTHVDEGGAIGETAARALLSEVRHLRGEGRS